MAGITSRMIILYKYYRCFREAPKAGRLLEYRRLCATQSRLLCEFDNVEWPRFPERELHQIFLTVLLLVCNAQSQHKIKN